MACRWLRSTLGRPAVLPRCCPELCRTGCLPFSPWMCGSRHGRCFHGNHRYVVHARRARDSSGYLVWRYGSCGTHRWRQLLCECEDSCRRKKSRSKNDVRFAGPACAPSYLCNLNLANGLPNLGHYYHDGWSPLPYLHAEHNTELLVALK